MIFLFAKAGFYIQYKKKEEVQKVLDVSVCQLPITKILGILNRYDSYSFDYNCITDDSGNGGVFCFFKKEQKEKKQNILNIKKGKDSIYFKTKILSNLSANVEYTVPSKEGKKFQNTRNSELFTKNFFDNHKISMGVEYYYTQ